MEDFSGKTVVVTGAASGIGLGIATVLAAEGAKICLADVEREPLERARTDLEKTGAEVIAVETDVSSRDAVFALADRAHDAFGKVHVLCNNAGVAGVGGGGGGGFGRGIWEAPDADWQWVLGVNLMGVVHGLQAFLPRMIEHGEPGYVVNTASIMGLTTGGGSIYSVSKHAVVRLSEGLYYDLRARGAKVCAAVLCPGLIATRIVTSARNRPQHLRIDVPDQAVKAFEQRQEMVERHFLAQGMPPEEVGRIVLRAMRAKDFYIQTHPELKSGVKQRMEDILADRKPSPMRGMGAAVAAGAGAGASRGQGGRGE